MRPDLTGPPAGGVGAPTPPMLPSAARQWLAIGLSLFLLLFLTDAVLSLADDSLTLSKIGSPISSLRLLVSVVSFLATIIVYALMALTPAIPKRLFIPLALFGPISLLAGIPFIIQDYERTPWINWIISFAEVIVGFVVYALIRGRGKPVWPVVPVDRLADPRFSWRNLVVFVLVNILGLVPAVVIYLFACASVGVDHFTGGFMALHLDGLTMQARTYTREDGKSIQLYPMAHVAEANFYQNIEQAFPTNSVILMEGVTDVENLLTNKISYKRMAKSLGLAEQHEKFIPYRGKIVPADIDVDEFSTNTIALLNLVMLIHGQGVNATNVQALLRYSPSPDFENELIDDLLLKRNQHLTEKIREELQQAEYIVVPWGVAHMPGISKEILKLGFRLQATQEYTFIHFFR